jgi:hypothetical protein
MEKKHIVYAVYDRNMADCYAYTLSIHHADHTIITPNHHITHLALIYILLVMKKTGHGIFKKGINTGIIMEGIIELNTYSNANSPIQLKTVFKLQESQL